jgi:hypothetical protein
MQLRKNFVYDPKRQGYDTNLWKTLTGVPSINASKLRLNSAEIIHYADLYGCDLMMRIILPAGPQQGDSRQFGLASVGLGAFLVFDITDDVFTIQALDGFGNTKSTIVSFDPNWLNDAIDFEIRWRGTYGDFLVNGVHVIDITDPADKKYAGNYRLNDIAVSKGPLSIYFNNDNADNMDIETINAKNIQTFL